MDICTKCTGHGQSGDAIQILDEDFVSSPDPAGGNWPYSGTWNSHELTRTSIGGWLRRTNRTSSGISAYNEWTSFLYEAMFIATGSSLIR